MADSPWRMPDRLCEPAHQVVRGPVCETRGDANEFVIGLPPASLDNRRLRYHALLLPFSDTPDYLQVTCRFMGYVTPTETLALRHISRMPVTRNFGRYCGNVGFQQMIAALTL